MDLFGQWRDFGVGKVTKKRSNIFVILGERVRSGRGGSADAEPVEDGVDRRLRRSEAKGIRRSLVELQPIKRRSGVTVTARCEGATQAAQHARHREIPECALRSGCSGKRFEQCARRAHFRADAGE